MKRITYTPEQQALIDAHPIIDPTTETSGNRFQCIPGVAKVEGTHVAVRTAAFHKGLIFMEPIPSRGLDNVDDEEWEIFHVNYIGMIKDQGYVWGSFVEGIGAFNVMVPIEYVRKLLPHEREYWSRVTLGMYGSHTGKLSQTTGSGVAKD